MPAHPTAITVSIATITWNQLTQAERNRIERNRRNLARYVGSLIFEAARPAAQKNGSKRAKCAK